MDPKLDFENVPKQQKFTSAYPKSVYVPYHHNYCVGGSMLNTLYSWQIFKYLDLFKYVLMEPDFNSLTFLVLSFQKNSQVFRYL